VGLYRRAWAHADATIDALPIDAVGHVPWWPADRNEVTLHRVMVHMLAETNRHAGHTDAVRELIDGAAGLRADNDNLGWHAPDDRLRHVARLQAVADTFPAQRSAPPGLS
jgi:hypothetical protein